MPRTATEKRPAKPRRWTGKTAGTFFLDAMIYNVQHINDPDAQLFSYEDLSEIRTHLTSLHDHEIFEAYSEMYTYVAERHNYARTFFQQFENGYQRLYNDLIMLQQSEQTLKTKTEIPLIMSRDQYNRLKDNAAFVLKNRRESYYSVIFNVLGECLNSTSEDTREIWKALQETKKIPAKEKEFSRQYNQLEGRIYQIIIPTGQRSDQMDFNEWLKAASEEAKKAGISKFAHHESILKKCELFFKGAKAIKAYVKERTGKSLTGTDKAIEKKFLETYIDIKPTGNEDHTRNAQLMEAALKPAEVTEVRFYDETDLPDGLTAFDLLQTLYAVHGTDTESRLHTLKTDFSEVYQAIESYLKERLNNPYDKDGIKVGELAEAGIIGYAEKLQPDDRNIVEIWTAGDESTEALIKRERASHGIAIIKQDPLTVYSSPDKTDHEGVDDGLFNLDFLANDLSNGIYHHDGKRIATLQSFVKDLVNPAILQIHAFNLVLSLISKVNNLPQLEIGLHIDTTFLKEKITAFNGILYYFYSMMVFGNDKDKQQTRAIIKKAFLELDLDIFHPSKQDIDLVRSHFVEVKFGREAISSYCDLPQMETILINSAKAALYGTN